MPSTTAPVTTPTSDRLPRRPATPTERSARRAPTRPTRRCRAAVAGSGIVAIAVASTVLLATDTDPSVSDAVGTGAVSATVVTELDLHGIPTAWSGRPARPTHHQPHQLPTAGPTELDLHGIPTAWSGRPARP